MTFVSCFALQALMPAAGVPEAEVYLLSGTPTEHSPGASFPVRLYAVSPEKKLSLVREVLPASEGLRLAYAFGDEIYAIHPSIVSTRVSIVHVREPKVVDEVEFNQHGLFPNDSAIAIAQPQTSSSRLLIPLLEDAHDAQRLHGMLVAVSANSSPTGQRVTLNSWTEYAALRCEGAPGGPAVFPVLVGSIADSKLAVSIYSHSIVVDSLPSPLRGARGIVPVIIAASPEYLVLGRQRTRVEMDAADLPDFTEEFVHARLLGQWRTIRIDGSSSSSRLFGPWLVTIVAYWNKDHRVSPGRENEREKGSMSVPSVREGYAAFRGRWNWSPGMLTLQNLADGRKIRIETGQEDSEILRVEGDTALYRVNDLIYQARIAGDQLKDTVLIVKDEDVPEIHWAFWSK